MAGVLATTAGITAIDKGGKAISKGTDAFLKNPKPLLITVVVMILLWKGPEWYRSIVAKTFIRNNPGSPYVRASYIIANSVKTFTIPSILGDLFSINYSTNENSINNALASVDSYPELASAYYKIFGRNLDSDLQNALDENELSDAFDIVNDFQTTTSFPVGSDLYVKSGQNITINEAVFKNGEWQPTNNLYGSNIHNAGDSIGSIEATGIVPVGMELAGQTYYIVKDCNWFGFDCDYGVVVHSQVTNKK